MGRHSEKGVWPEITGKPSYSDHVTHALTTEFCLTKEILTPPEIITSSEWISSTPQSEILSFRSTQYEAIQLVRDAAPTQAVWGNLTRQALMPATEKFQADACHQLLSHFDVGGDRWIGQFAHGFPTSGILIQEGVFPSSDKPIPPPIHLKQIWQSPTKMFKERARSSGFKNAQPLWGEALTQVSKGWLEGPREVSHNGAVACFDRTKFNFAFRFGGEQMNKLRECDDIRRNLVNLCTSVITPITHPNWDHIAQLIKDAFRTNTKWTFLKAAHDSEYEKLTLDPDFAGITVVALRGPATSKWRAFFPRALLFGSVSAVTHYNCFARSLAVLTILTLGIPALNYFGDFGALVPDPLGTMALWMVENTRLTLGAPMETTKSLVGTQLTFLGLLGSSPDLRED